MQSPKTAVFFVICLYIYTAGTGDKEEAGILFLAWRCLYAEVVSARLENRHLKLQKAYARMIRLIISRLKANNRNGIDGSAKRGTSDGRKLNSSRGDIGNENLSEPQFN